MKYLKKGIKAFVKILLLIIIIPIFLHAGFLFVQSFMRTCSIYTTVEPLEYAANDFMAKYGNRYFAFDLIYYFKKEREPFLHEEANHDIALAKLVRRYPDMNELYLGAMVDAILDKKTSNYNRVNLIYMLEEHTGIDFTGCHKVSGIEYEDLKLYTQKGIRNIANWWSKRLQERATAAIAATEKDYLFPPLPSESKQKKPPKKKNVK